MEYQGARADALYVARIALTRIPIYAHGPQVTIVPLGAHSTNAAAAMRKYPPPPAYDRPRMQSMITRNALIASLEGKTTDSLYDVKGDINKAAAALYRLSELSSPPLRLVLGKWLGRR